MNAIQEAKLGMYHSVLAYLDANDAIITAIPAFKIAVGDLRATVSAINQVVQQQVRSITGIAVNKSASKKNLAGLTTKMADTLYAFAFDTHDAVMKAAVRISRSRLQRCRDAELVPRSRNILELVQTHQQALHDYGITAASITAFQGAVDAYDSAMPAPRNAVAERVAYRKKLQALFREADSTLNDRIGKLIAAFAGDAPAFVNVYMANRSIINPPRTVTQLRGTVINKETKKPVVGALVRLPQLGIVVKTNTRGNFLIKPLPRGMYTVTISSEGLEPQEISDVNIILGHINRLQIQMKPIVQDVSP